MANDFTLAVRRASLATLKGDARLSALVPPEQMHPQSTPSKPLWPFTKMGAPTSTPVGATCVDGNEGIFAVHGFAKVRTDAGAVVETAEDHAARIGAFIASALDRKVLELDGDLTVKLRWTGSQLLQDPDEADAYHTVQNFRYRVIA